MPIQRPLTPPGSPDQRPSQPQLPAMPTSPIRSTTPTSPGGVPVVVDRPWAIPTTGTTRSKRGSGLQDLVGAREHLRALRLSLDGRAAGVVGAAVTERRHTRTASASRLIAQAAEADVEDTLRACMDVRGRVERLMRLLYPPEQQNDHAGLVVATNGVSRHSMTGARLELLWEWKAYLQAVARRVNNCLEKTASGPQANIFTAVSPTEVHQEQQLMLNLQRENITKDIEEAKRRILEAQRLAIPPDREMVEQVIAPRGDAILEFSHDLAAPMLRFRVSSHMLAEASPLFARIFDRDSDNNNGSSNKYRGLEGSGSSTFNSGIGSNSSHIIDDIPPSDDEMPLSPPTQFLWQDGAETQLYRMPQLERDREGALGILLHAAHFHNDDVPRDVTFPRFVAIAEACLRYRCTGPLEVVVEHRWLPRWVQKATDPMPDGLLVISYAFGLRRLFTRVSKSVVLNLVSEEELEAKTWPRRVKDRIWAMRCAKVEQVHAACVAAAEEYLRPTPVKESCAGSGSGSGLGIELSDHQSPTMSAPVPVPPSQPSRFSTLLSLGSNVSLISNSSNASEADTCTPSPFHHTASTIPRCPRGSRACDALGVGWLMLALNDLQLLCAIARPDALAAAAQKPPARSLAQLVDALRAIPSPPSMHGGGGTAPAFHPLPNNYSSSSANLSSSYDDTPTSHLTFNGGASSSAIGSLASACRVCDPATAFRSAVNDVYNSVTGLTLYDVAGRHGWALSRTKRNTPQAVLRVRMPSLPLQPTLTTTTTTTTTLTPSGYSTMLSPPPRSPIRKNTRMLTGIITLPELDSSPPPPSVPLPPLPGQPTTTTTTTTIITPTANNKEDQDKRHLSSLSQQHLLDEEICLAIMDNLATLKDLRSLALTNRAFYAVFKKHEPSLTRKFVLKERGRTLEALTARERKMLTHENLVELEERAEKGERVSQRDLEAFVKDDDEGKGVKDGLNLKLKGTDATPGSLGSLASELDKWEKDAKKGGKSASASRPRAVSVGAEGEEEEGLEVEDEAKTVVVVNDGSALSAVAAVESEGSRPVSEDTAATTSSVVVVSTPSTTTVGSPSASWTAVSSPVTRRPARGSAGSSGGAGSTSASRAGSGTGPPSSSGRSRNEGSVVMTREEALEFLWPWSSSSSGGGGKKGDGKAIVVVDGDIKRGGGNEKDGAAGEAKTAAATHVIVPANPPTRDSGDVSTGSGAGAGAVDAERKEGEKRKEAGCHDNDNGSGGERDEEAGQKFLLEEVMLVTQKTLSVIDGKQLRGERDLRIGLFGQA